MIESKASSRISNERYAVPVTVTVALSVTVAVAITVSVTVAVSVTVVSCRLKPIRTDMEGETETATVKMEAGVENNDMKIQTTLPANAVVTTLPIAIAFSRKTTPLLPSRDSGGPLKQMSGIITRKADDHLLRRKEAAEPRDLVWCILLVNPTTAKQAQRIELEGNSLNSNEGWQLMAVGGVMTVVPGETVFDLAEAACRRYEEHRSKDFPPWSDYLRLTEVLHTDHYQEMVLIDGRMESDGLFETTTEDTLKMEDIKRLRDTRTTEDIKTVPDIKRIPRDIMKIIETMEEAADIKNMTDIKIMVEEITGMTMAVPMVVSTVVSTVVVAVVPMVMVSVAGETTCHEEN